MKQFIKKIIKSIQKSKRRLFSIKEAEFIKELDKIPVQKGDNLFIHSRLSTIGYFDFSPNVIIDYFLAKVGAEGNVFMPSFSSNDYAFKYLANKVTFDPLSTPSKMGMLTEIFLKDYQAKRSIHATHSVLGIGKNAAEVLNSHHLSQNPFDESSPFYKFLQLPHPKVLCFGLTMYPATIFRVFESIHYKNYPVKVFLDSPFYYQAKVNNEIMDLKTLAHNPEASNLRRNMLFENQFLKRGILRSYKIGNSKSYLLDANNFLAIMEENYEKGNLPYIGHFSDLEKDAVNENRLAMTWESW